MRLIRYSLLLIVLFSYCSRQKNSDHVFILDPALRDTVRRHIELISDKQSSYFKTPLDARFFSDGVLTDSLIEPDFDMSSWYHYYKDTIDLVAHVGSFETRALLVRFIHGTPHVYFFLAPHENQRYFKLNKTDTFTDHIEVSPVRYKLGLSVIPDTIQKPVVFGTIDMESRGYYDQRDSLGRRSSVSLKFYFRSKYRSFK